jgi:hypothetical protein
MAGINVDAGICGFVTNITVKKISKKSVRIDISSDCEMVTMAGQQLQEVEWMKILHPEGCLSLISKAFTCIKHPACPVITAIFKAIEVEVGLALPKDSHIRFIK